MKFNKHDCIENITFDFDAVAFLFILDSDNV